MPDSEKPVQRYKVWLRQAEFDLQAANVSNEAGFYEWVCFQSQQVVEKALKSILVHAGWKPPRIHKLAILMGMANDANEQFKATKFEFKHLQAFTFISRYPFLIPGEHSAPHDFIEAKDAQKCINQAEQFLQKVKNLLKD